MRCLALAVVAAVGLLSSSGCFLPLTTAAPQSATTLGKGYGGVNAYAEFPSVNLTATRAPDTQSQGDYLAPSLVGVLEASYGLTDKLDLEFGVEGEFYLFFLPLPTGAHAGVRYQLLETDDWKAAGAARFGYSSFSSSSEGSDYNIQSWNGMLSGVIQYSRLPVFHPSLALSFFPATVRYSGAGLGDGRTGAYAASAMLNLNVDLGVFEVTPFIGAVGFTSGRINKPFATPQFGIALAFRGGKTSMSVNDQVHMRQRPKDEAPPPAPEPAPAPSEPKPSDEGTTPTTL